MPARSQQAAIVVLAMNFDQICANFPVQRSRTGLFVDKGPTASINPPCTADDPRFARFDVDAIFGQNGPERVPGPWLQVSGGSALPFLPLPPQAALGPSPNGQPQGLQQNRLCSHRTHATASTQLPEFPVHKTDTGSAKNM